MMASPSTCRTRHLAVTLIAIVSVVVTVVVAPPAPPVPAPTSPNRAVWRNTNRRKYFDAEHVRVRVQARAGGVDIEPARLHHVQHAVQLSHCLTTTPEVTWWSRGDPPRCTAHHRPSLQAASVSRRLVIECNVPVARSVQLDCGTAVAMLVDSQATA